MIKISRQRLIQAKKGETNVAAEKSLKEIYDITDGHISRLVHRRYIVGYSLLGFYLSACKSNIYINGINFEFVFILKHLYNLLTP